MTFLSFLSGIPFVGFLTNLPDVVKRWLVLALVAVSCFGFGHLHGVSSAELDFAEQRVELVKVIRKVEVKAQEISDQHSNEVHEQKEKIRVVYKTITKEVIKYAETPAANVPVLDPDFGLLINASALGCSPADPACRADASIPGNTTPGEVAQRIVESDQLYQECRTTVIGWQNYYKELKDHYDSHK